MEHQDEYHDSMVAMLELVWVGRHASWLRNTEPTSWGPTSSRRFSRLVELIGKQAADRAVENWRATVVVCEKGEMIQGYSRGRRPT